MPVALHKVKTKNQNYVSGRTEMKKATKMTMAGAALLFAVAIATSAFGFGWGRGPGFDSDQCPGGPGAGYRGVTLTTEQKAELKKMRDTHFQEMRPLQKEMFAKRDAVRKLWLAPEPDQAAIAAAQKDMRSLRDQLEDKMTAFRLNAMKVLTPEQRNQIQSSIAEHGSGPMRGRGHRPWGGGGAGCVGPSAQ
jgi:Spy/CpxP family protein refolding chaperone